MPRVAASLHVTAASDPHVDDVDAYSIPEWCRRHGVCRGTYYNMKANGTAPREFRMMGRVMISREEAHRWRENATVQGDGDQRLEGVAA
jgi:predicted DNA-binding transcriptional regulator AlpA